jgi:hypothetical protein
MAIADVVGCLRIAILLGYTAIFEGIWDSFKLKTKDFERCSCCD